MEACDTRKGHSVDKANQVIVEVTPHKVPKLEIETNSGKKYLVDLTSFRGVFCFPKTQAEWNRVCITTAGYGLTWPSRFEVHVDQAIDHAAGAERMKKRA